jgi:formylmethanofuran dehydrogenase subunit E
MVNGEQKQIQTKIEVKTSDTLNKEQLLKCDLCGEYHEESVMHGFLAKGKKKYICQECADTVHGLI